MRKLVLDFETFYSKDFSLTKLTTFQYVMDERFHVWGAGAVFLDEDGDVEWYGATEVEDFILSVDWENVEVICHNVAFDAFILTQHYGVTPARFVCTASMARALGPNYPASLAKVSERYLSKIIGDYKKGDALPKAKGIYDLPEDLEQEIAEYCIQDVRLTKLIYNLMIKVMPAEEMEMIDLTARMTVMPRLVADKERLIAFKESEVENSERLIAASGYERSQLASNDQFVGILAELGINVPLKVSPSVKGKLIPAFGKSDQGFLDLQKEHPEHKALWEARLASKSRINETRAQRFIDATLPDGTIPMPLKFYGAHTGRFSGGEKMNVQNMPRGGELRLSLCSPEDELVYVIDLSQIEARLLAWLANERKISSIFEAKGDVYADFASRFYKEPINKDDHPIKRFVGKTSVLGLGYGVGHLKFHTILTTGAMGPPVDITLGEARSLVDFYRREYSMVPKLWRRAKDLIYKMCDPRQEGYSYGPLTVGDECLILPNGLSLQYPGLKSLNGEGYYNARGAYIKLYGAKLVENIIQALARIVICDAMVKANEYFKTLGGRCVLQVHDEIVLVGPKKNPDRHFKVLHDIVTTPPEWCKDLFLEAEGGYDARYSK